MARRKTPSTRTLTRIACRRAGIFNTREYRAGVRRRKDLATELAFWLGVALTIISAGAAIPITALLMFPKVASWFTK